MLNLRLPAQNEQALTHICAISHQLLPHCTLASQHHSTATYLHTNSTPHKAPHTLTSLLPSTASIMSLFVSTPS